MKKNLIKIISGIMVINVAFSNIVLADTINSDENITQETNILNNQEQVEDISTYTNSMNSAKEINLNEENGYYASSFGDYWVKFTVPEQGYITIDCKKPIDSSGEIGDMRFTLNNASNSLVKEISTHSVESPSMDRYTFKIGLTEGEYYLNMKSSYSIQSGYFYIDYNIGFNPTKDFEIEPNASKMTATEIKINQSVTGVKENSLDTDYYKITVDNDSKVNMNIKRDFNVVGRHHYYKITNPDGSTTSISEEGMNIGTNGTLNKNIILKAGTSYIEAIHDIDCVEYTMTFEELPNNTPVINSSDIVFKVGDVKYSSDLTSKLLNNVTATDEEDGDLTSKIKIKEQNVDYKTPGEYRVIYQVTDNDKNTTTKENKVTVNPNMKPIITSEDKSFPVGTSIYSSELLKNITATDEEDGDLTSKVKVKEHNINSNIIGEYKVIYEVTDSVGNVTTNENTVTIRSNEKPIINAKDISILQGMKFNPLESITATDKEDGDITQNIYITTNNVNTSKPGRYAIVYNVADSDGNTQNIRTYVTVTATDWYNHWGYNEIKYAMEKGWIKKSETFRPADDITRAEFVKIVNRSFGYTDSGNVPFTDVKEGLWYYNEVAIAIKAGYITTKNETFRPNDPITREEIASIVTTINDNKDTNLDRLSKYNDANLVSSWAKSSVEGAIEAGYMGANSTMFNPKKNITRGEAVVTLYRVVKK